MTATHRIEPSKSSSPRIVQAGPWRVTLHPPVLVYEGSRTEHITRPNLCVLDGAVGVLFQTTFDTSATPKDDRNVSVSTDGGRTWRVATRHAEIGSYSLFSKPTGQVVVMPYDSIRLAGDAQTVTGPRATLRWDGSKLHIDMDRTTIRFPEPLRCFAPEPILDDAGKPMYLDDDIVPADKPITCFWGTIQELEDGRWIVPVYSGYESEPLARNSPAPEMRRMTRFTADLFTSSDEGRSWSWYSRVASPADLPDECVEGPCEAQLYRFGNRWRILLRTSALKNHFQPMRYVESQDAGRTWNKPRLLPESRVGMIMDPRGLMLPDGITVLSAGRPKIDLYLAEGDSLEFHPLDMTAHHNAYLPRLRTTGHTDVIALGPRMLLFVYDYIPDSWRWPGTPFTAPDAIYCVRVEIEA